MKKRFTIIAAAVALLACGASADVLTPEQALGRLNSGASKAPAVSGPAQLTLQRTVLTESKQPAAYLFLKADKRGYMLLSADDQTEAVLGYSDAPVTADTPVPPQLKGQMDFYAAEIEALRTGKVRSVALAPVARADISGRQPIAPLVTTRWNQGEPYNSKTPVINGNATLTGCGATALAQVLNYYKYPAHGIGNGTCTIGVEYTPETISLEEDIDWANMADDYPGTDVQNDAVATLMKLCGYAVGMNYNVGWSESSMTNILLAVVNNFGYAPSAYLQQMQNYSLPDWEELLYDNLREYGPMIYRGYSAQQGGHIFVCDGYDRDNYFHFNWGWSGAYDGYFKVSALNPDVSYTGISDGGFTSGAWALLGMKPFTGEPFKPLPLLTMNSISIADVLDNVLYFYANVLNATYTEMSVQVGLRIRNTEDGTIQYVVPGTYRNEKLMLWSGWNSFEFDLSGIEYKQNVRYDIELVSRHADGSGEWHNVQTVFENRGHCIMHDGTKWVVYNYSYLCPSLTIVEKPEIFYIGARNRVEVELSNRFSVPIYTYLYPQIEVVGESRYAAGDGFMIELQPGETIRKNVYVSVKLTYDASSQYKLLFVSDFTAYDPVGINMAENPGTASVSAPGGIIFNGGTSNVVDPAGFDIALDLSCTEGYYGNAVRFQLYTRESDGKYYLKDIATTEPVCIGSGESRRASVHVSIPEEVYSGVTTMYAVAFEMFTYGQLTMPTEFTLQQSGVSQSVADGGTLKIGYDKSAGRLTVTSGSAGVAVQAYSVDGKCVALPVDGGAMGLTADVSLLPPGVYVVVATDASGARATAKIVR